MQVLTDRLIQTDGVMPYIDWAVGNGFGVMDINIPRYITRPQVGRPHGRLARGVANGSCRTRNHIPRR